MNWKCPSKFKKNKRSFQPEVVRLINDTRYSKSLTLENSWQSEITSNQYPWAMMMPLIHIAHKINWKKTFYVLFYAMFKEIIIYSMEIPFKHRYYVWTAIMNKVQLFHF